MPSITVPVTSEDWDEKKFHITGPDFECAAHSHIGYSRPSNQDRFVIHPLKDGAVLIALADGLGGERAGDRASETVCAEILKIEHIPAGEEEKALAHLARVLDMEIRDLGRREPDMRGIGTTLIMALVREFSVWWLHIGDSRLYVFRHPRLDRITEDQTLARFLIKENILDPEDAPDHYSRHIMDQFVGCGYCEAESGSFGICSGDALVLASDGVYRYLSETTLAAVLGKPAAPDRQCSEIVETVLKDGGKDNLTIMIFRQTEKA